MHSFLRFGKESPVAKNMKKWGMGMVTLNDYLYSGDTVLKIIQRFQNDLKEDAKRTENGVDIIHCNFLLQLMELFFIIHFAILLSIYQHNLNNMVIYIII